jgi:hypothetical protein
VGTATAFLTLLVGLPPMLASTVHQAPDEPMDPSLRRRVVALKASYRDGGNDPAVVRERLDTLWEWGNALALQGVVIPHDFPITMGMALRAVRGGGADGEAIPFARIDQIARRWIRELRIKEGMPDAIGRLELDPPGPFTADQLVTVKQIYTVGSMPMAEGGGVIIANQSPVFTPKSRIQTDDPAGEGYVTARCSREGARLVLTEPWGTGMDALTMRPVSAFRLEGATLVTGDTITVTYGDTTAGSPGLRIQPTSNSRVILPLYVDLEANGDRLSPEFPWFEVRGLAKTTFVNAVAPSVVAPGERFELAVRSEDRFKSPVGGAAPAYLVRLGGEVIANIPAGDQAVSVLRNLELASPGVYRFEVQSADGRLRGRSNPVWVRPHPSFRIYWGDTHGHIGFADGQGTIDGYFSFGRDVARLDFLTLSEHDIWMDAGEWRALRRAAERYLDPGRFTPVAGYEWTTESDDGGHHNVYFRNPGRRELVRRQLTRSLEELYAGLRRLNHPEDVLVIPHTHEPADWNRSDPDIERLVEMQSGHGSFEWHAVRYLDKGLRVGFIGSSDNHAEHPGYSPSTNQQLGGLAAVMAAENTRDALFDALRARSAYATTGERIVLDADLNGVTMGNEVPAEERRVIRCRAMGTEPIDAIDLIRNGDVVYSKRYISPVIEPRTRLRLLFEASSEAFNGLNKPRRGRAWRGSITVSGARLASVTGSWFHNPFTTEVRRDPAHPGRATFKMVTRGRGESVLLELDGAGPETVVVVEVEASKESAYPNGADRPAAALPAINRTLHLADLLRSPAIEEQTIVRSVDRVRLQLEPGDSALDQEFHYTDLGDTSAGDYYYLRVRQVDGSMAWSSPWWVGGERPVAQPVDPDSGGEQ